VSPRVPWIRISAAGAVIVASILLALAGDAWWHERGKRAEERELLTDLRSEFAESVEEKRVVIGIHQEGRARIDTLMSRTATDLLALSQEEVDRYATALWAFTTFNDRIGALDCGARWIKRRVTQSMRGELRAAMQNRETVHITAQVPRV